MLEQTAALSHSKPWLPANEHGPGMPETCRESPGCADRRALPTAAMKLHEGDADP